MASQLKLEMGEGGSTEFPWPAPPYLEFVQEQDRSAWSDCLAVFRDGTRVTGKLLSFNPDPGLLSLKPDGNSEVVSVAFSMLLRLQLLQPVRLRREILAAAEAADAEAPRHADNYPFRIELINGEKFLGTTLGYVSAICGLFLYFPEKTGEVVRCFVPAQAAKSCHIDAPIGQVLIDQKVVSPEAVGAALNMQAMMRTQKLGAYLTANRFVSSEQLAVALALQRERPSQRLGDTLLELGSITKSELDMALRAGALERSMPLGVILRDKMGIIDDRSINGALANKLGIPSIDLKVSVASDVIARIPAVLAHQLRAVPVREADGALVVAMENPLDEQGLEELRAMTRMKVQPATANQDDLMAALTRYYGPIGSVATTLAPVIDRRKSSRTSPKARAAERPEAGIQELMSRLDNESGSQDVAEAQAVRSDSALVALVNRIVIDAVQQNASDIHIESNQSPKPTRIRFRKDGTLVNYIDLPAQFCNAVVSRIKIMSRLDITERRKPQDGKIDFSRFGAAKVELRVATVPTTGGLEDVVMRLLAAAKPVSMDELNLESGVRNSIKRLISKPHGLFLVCGPTGSGKTTTLHSLLAFLNTAERKIWTAEDPIEITQSGLRQVQVHPKIGWTFAAAMRSFMRADPDVIMVGEMRDAETARIGIEASLTGHLVLSTLHTNSSAESIVRLLDLGMDPFNFADALLGVLAARLARRLCPACRSAYTPTDAELEELARQYCNETPLDVRKQLKAWAAAHAGANGRITLYRAHGCESCDRTGYKGRVGLYELLVSDEATKKLLQSKAHVSDVKTAAIASGMRTLRQDGIEKVLEGLTDIQQVNAVCA